MKKRYVSIVGTIIGGSSCNGWFGKLCGSETVIKQIGSEGDIEVYVNSPGGSVFAAFEIVNAFNAAISAGRKVDIFVSPLAASAASYISTAVKGATVHMAENAKLMFHAPWTGLYGSKKELEDAAELLDKLEDDIKAAVLARSGTVDETWFDTGRMKFLSVKEAIKMKLADRIGNPSAELITFVSEQGSGGSDSIWGKCDQKEKAQSSNVGIDYELFAANVEFQGYLKHLCDEHFGEQTQVRDVTSDTFKVVRGDGECTLLKYEPNSLTIVAIDWEASASNEEEDMNKVIKPKDLKVDEPVVEPAPEPVAKEPVANVPVVEPVVEPAPESTPEPVAKEPAPEPAPEPVANEEGLTPDMIAFAKENYQKARAEFLDKIKGNAENVFTDEELDGFSIKMLEKLALLADKPAKVVTSTADNSIVPSPKGSMGTGGSLPPPKF